MIIIPFTRGNETFFSGNTDLNTNNMKKKYTDSSLQT